MRTINKRDSGHIFDTSNHTLLLYTVDMKTEYCLIHLQSEFAAFNQGQSHPVSINYRMGHVRYRTHSLCVAEHENFWTYNFLVSLDYLRQLFKVKIPHDPSRISKKKNRIWNVKIAVEVVKNFAKGHKTTNIITFLKLSGIIISRIYFTNAAPPP